jgi:hypothetical protein
MLSLLGNRKLNTSMETLADLIFLRCMATNSTKAGVSIGPAEVLYEEGNREVSSVQFR